MSKIKYKLAAIFMLITAKQGMAGLPTPVSLMTDLLEHTEAVSQDGFLSSMSTDDLTTSIESHQQPVIRTSRPIFGWVMLSDEPNTHQTSYRILVASSQDIIKENRGDVWDSGTVRSDKSTSVAYEGDPLSNNKIYYWTVQIEDNHGNKSEFAKPKSFVTSPAFDEKPSTYPIQLVADFPSSINNVNDSTRFIAFERAAFGSLLLTLESKNTNDTVTIRLGEKSENGRVYRKPPESKSSIRYAEYRLGLRQGRHTYALKIKPDKRNTDISGRNESGVSPVLMPGYIGEVYPFRFCELEGYDGPLERTDMMRKSARYPFNSHASLFESSDTVLNKVWDLSKYSIEATSFTGIYIDGDRERIAYEADALIGQLGHYCTDREYSMARASLCYLMDNPTWPTEWNLQLPIIAWADYLHTGDPRPLEKNYDLLKSKTLSALKGENGLISIKNIADTTTFHQTLNFKGKKLKDIVDWPQNGYVGNEKERAGEADGYVRKAHNTVVNAYHYQTLLLMEKIAETIGRESDKKYWAKEANKMKNQFNRLLFNDKTGHYKDGVETDHESLHGNMFPLAFGLVPENRKKAVIDFIKERRMACSVYGAQFLLDALYGAEEADYALALLTSTGERSWYNMARAGSTITMEAWDDKYKPNQDWNHIWGAAPANLIPRGLFGIEPTEPGFSRFKVKPQPASLEWAKLTLPTIKGDIAASFENVPGKSFNMTLRIPANTKADIEIPRVSEKCHLTLNGKQLKTPKGRISVTLGSGEYVIKATAY